jgi:sRNA-binding protein
MSLRKRREAAARANAVIGALSELWPHTFVVCERRRKPLALGIDKALLAAAEPAISADAVTVKDIKAALRRYVSAEGYLRACRRAGKLASI